MASSLSGRRRRLGELLIDSQLLSEEQLKAALHEQRKWGGRLGRTVVEMGFVTESAMVTVLAGQLQLRTVDLDAARLPARVTDAMRLDLAERYGVFPLGIDGNTVFVATSDPTNLEQLQEIEFATNKKVQVAVATASSIERAIRRYYFGEDPEVSQTIHPRNLGVAMYELDQGAPAVVVAPVAQSLAPRPAAEPRPVPRAAPAVTSRPTPAPAASLQGAAESQAAREAVLRREVAVLREQVDSLEAISASQVKALRSLMEILVESGLITREEYLARQQGRDADS